MAVARGLNGSIVTVYEVQHGDVFSDSGGFLAGIARLDEACFTSLLEPTDFNNIDSLVLNRILSILEKQGKATVFQGNDSSDSGIKFA